jgi:Domain of unknown function (DUF3560)
MTYRERREARVERLREWAAKREQGAGAVLASHDVFRGDIAFNTQPGHIPFRARVSAQDDRAYESLRKAASMEHRADGIEGQLASSNYSDDPDTIEQLKVRLADLQAERNRIKAFNVSCRAGTRELSLLTERELATYLGIAKLCAYSLGKHGEFPGYHLTNLSGNIARKRERLAELIRKQA